MHLPGSPAVRLALIVAVSVALYLPLELADAGYAGDHAVNVAVCFLVVPLLMLLLMGQRPSLGRPDRWALLGVAVYVPFSAWAVAYVPSNAEFFRAWAQLDEGGAAVAWRAIAVCVNVAAVDFFSRRVVQLEAARVWGDAWGFVIATLAWMIAHVPEALWLDDLMGPAASVAFITVAGLATGWVYMRGRNVLGLMVGHATLNLILMAATAAMTG